MEDIRGVRLRKFELKKKIVLGVRMHFRHSKRTVAQQSSGGAAGKWCAKWASAGATVD